MSKLLEITPVSSAKLAWVVSLEWVISAVKMCIVGARMLPWGNIKLIYLLTIFIYFSNVVGIFSV